MEQETSTTTDGQNMEQVNDVTMPDVQNEPPVKKLSYGLGLLISFLYTVLVIYIFVTTASIDSTYLLPITMIVLALAMIAAIIWAFVKRQKAFAFGLLTFFALALLLVSACFGLVLSSV